jgi:hypothetical protein
MNLIPFVSLSPTLLFVAILKAPPPALLSITMLMECALQGLPDWAQAEVEQQIRAIAGGHLTPAHAAILTRLMTDPRMSKVWKELSRLENAEFRHSARSPELPDDEKEAEVSNEQIWGSAEITPEDSDEIVKAKLEETKRKFERQRRQDIQAEAIAWVIPLTSHCSPSRVFCGNKAKRHKKGKRGTASRRRRTLPDGRETISPCRSITARSGFAARRGGTPVA